MSRRRGAAGYILVALLAATTGAVATQRWPLLAAWLLTRNQPATPEGHVIKTYNYSNGVLIP